MIIGDSDWEYVRDALEAQQEGCNPSGETMSEVARILEEIRTGNPPRADGKPRCGDCAHFHEEYRTYCGCGGDVCRQYKACEAFKQKRDAR